MNEKKGYRPMQIGSITLLWCIAHIYVAPYMECKRRALSDYETLAPYITSQ